MSNIEENKNYWDYVSVNKQQFDKKEKDPFKSALKDTFPEVANRLIDNLFWVNALVLYLNVYCGVPQTDIAKILNMSQFGVSKRYRSSKRKIQLLMQRPIHNKIRLRKFLQKFLNSDEIEPVVIFYFTGLFSISNRILFNTKYILLSTTIKRIINKMERIAEMDDREFVKTYRNLSIDIDKKIIKRIKDYLKILVEVQLIGNFLFKIDKYKDRFDFDDKVIFE